MVSFARKKCVDRRQGYFFLYNVNIHGNELEHFKMLSTSRSIDSSLSLSLSGILITPSVPLSIKYLKLKSTDRSVDILYGKIFLDGKIFEIYSQKSSIPYEKKLNFIDFAHTYYSSILNIESPTRITY